MKDLVVVVEVKDKFPITCTFDPHDSESFEKFCLDGLNMGKVFVNDREIIKAEYLIPHVGLQKTWHYKGD